MSLRAVAQTPHAVSSTTLHMFRIATTEDIPDAMTRYERLVERGEIHPAARAMWVTGIDRRGALSPPHPPSVVRDVVIHVVR